ncbi:hypothetical protein AB0C80_37685 [Streptomyces anthocyanicus]|uniref:hypothetical protein n=1 Tax=Streptomyces anthocyanicus TaxID=68174 RepID=UPI00340F1F90
MDGLDLGHYPASRGRAAVEREGGSHADRHRGPQPEQLPHDQRSTHQEQSGQHRRQRLVMVVSLVAHQSSP